MEQLLVLSFSVRFQLSEFWINIIYTYLIQLGNGVKWFGAANSSSYTVQLNANGQPVGPETIGNPRSYQQSAELPSTIACDNSTAWGCKVLAEFSDLTDNVQYEVVLTTLFEGDTTGNKLDLLATQVLRNTTLPE
jgi:hypothetical protein